MKIDEKNALISTIKFISSVFKVINTQNLESTNVDSIKSKTRKTNESIEKSCIL